MSNYIAPQLTAEDRDFLKERAGRNAEVNEIRERIQIGVFMSLGATGLKPANTDQPMLEFTARILPMTKSGKRGTRPRLMTVQVGRDPATPLGWIVTASYRTGSTFTTHAQVRFIHQDDLSRILLSLDYDGHDVLNPRLSYNY